MAEEHLGANIAGLTKGMANHILSRMGESGQPPEHGIQYINVGNETLLEIIKSEYLDLLLEHARGSAFKLVQGYYGGGKTHFLHCVRDMAWDKHFLTSTVNLSPTECPYEDPYRVYKAVVANLCAAPDMPGSEPIRSLPDVLRTWVEDSLSTQTTVPIEDWVRSTALRIPVDNHTYRRALAEYVKAIVKQDNEGEYILEAWMRGDAVPRADLRRFGIFEVIDKTNAFQALCSMVQVLMGYGFAGVVIFFDEAERNMSTTQKRIHQFGDNLRQVIDLCGSSKLPGVLFFYAVPPEFMRTIVPNYPALEQRLKSPLSMSRHSPQSAIIDLEKLELEPEELLAAIGVKILKVCQVAWEWEPAEAIEISNINLLASVTAQHIWETGHRREFVKFLISFLRQQYSSGESLLSRDEALRIVSRQDQSLAEEAADFDDYE